MPEALAFWNRSCDDPNKRFFPARWAGSYATPLCSFFGREEPSVCGRFVSNYLGC
jgi:hypothetical protein